MTPDTVILHCSATPDGEVHDWAAIRRYHIEVKGWTDIGYQYGIEMVGGHYRMLTGRKPSVIGAHCRAEGMNHRSVGVCVVGRFDDGELDPDVLKVTTQALTLVCFHLGIPPRRIRFHRDYESRKTCPGLLWDRSVVQSMVEDNLCTGHDLLAGTLDMSRLKIR